MLLFQNHIIRQVTLFLLLCTFASAQDQILSGGELTGFKIWRGTIVIQGDITIPSGSQLNIEPGTKIYFAANRDDLRGGNDKTRSELIVRGKLIARGTAESKIIFTSRSPSPRMGDWYGLQFLHSQPGCVLDYSVVEYAYNGITIKNTSLPVVNCEIRYNYNAGIRAEVKASPKIIQNIITQNGYAGLVCELGATPTLTDNLINQNSIGVVVLSLSKPNLGSLQNDADYNPGRNQFANNEEYDLYNHSAKSVVAQNNSWDSDGRPKLFDQEDNRKYGSITFDPKLNQRSGGNLLLLAQNRAVNPAQPPAATQNINLESQENTQSSTVQTINNEASGDTSAELSGFDSLLYNVSAIHTASSATPLQAYSSGSGSEADNSPINIGEIKAVIDYNQVFLEPFLDERSRRIMWKEELVINETMRKVIEPGEVRIKVTVDADGRVESATVLRGINPILDDEILQTVRKYKYIPGTVNGKKVRFSTNEVFRFK